MFYYKVKRKGYFLVYVMLLGFFIITTVVVTITYELKRAAVLKIQAQKIMSNSKIERNRQYLFNDFYTFLMFKGVIIKKDEIIKFLSKNKSSVSFNRDSVTLNYDKNEQLVYIQYAVNSSCNYLETYEIRTENEKLSFKLLSKIIL